LAAIEARGLTKSFGGRPACRDISFSVERGEVFGLLGPNGAGKTTTLRMLAGLFAPDAGSAQVAGFEIAPGRPGGPELRGRVGLLTEQPGFYDRLTARENLDYFARLQGAREGSSGPLLERFALASHADRPFAELSRGMKQKLAIARALVHEPEVIFLDEPTVGLDPEATREVRSVIEELAREHATIVLCTHHLDEVERLCSRAAFIAGRMLAVHEVKGEDFLRIDLAAPVSPAGGAGLARDGRSAEHAASNVRALCKSVRVEGNALYLEPIAEVHEIVAALVQAGARVEAVAPHRDPLEEAWLQLLAEAREQGLTA
jgi:ABC-2 type transport system ATP-binding protein